MRHRVLPVLQPGQPLSRPQLEHGDDPRLPVRRGAAGTATASTGAAAPSAGGERWVRRRARATELLIKGSRHIN